MNSLQHFCATLALFAFLPLASLNVVAQDKSFLNRSDNIAAVAQRTFYVDSENGRDEHEGRSDAQAWQSLTRVNAAELLLGDAVQSKRGGIWRGSLRPASGDADAAISYTSYGRIKQLYYEEGWLFRADLLTEIGFNQDNNDHRLDESTRPLAGPNQYRLDRLSGTCRFASTTTRAARQINTRRQCIELVIKIERDRSVRTSVATDRTLAIITKKTNLHIDDRDPHLRMDLLID
ncbi:MAG TPA: hypothetical protein PLY87_08025 [Planctomycetaceae bacterium]|nr:hypothetical protein [Planctomycetaceae bacterium]HQZ65007.1 hypothetical protein [Planctomycetaceae bacterium]